MQVPTYIFINSEEITIHEEKLCIGKKEIVKNSKMVNYMDLVKMFILL